jgi:hypothetical protein
MKNKNKMRITGVFLLAIASLSMVIVVASTLTAASKDKSYMTSENILVHDRLLDNTMEDERLLDKFWEEDRIHNGDSQDQYQPGAGGFGDIGAPEDTPF